MVRRAVFDIVSSVLTCSAIGCTVALSGNGGPGIKNQFGDLTAQARSAEGAGQCRHKEEEGKQGKRERGVRRHGPAVITVEVAERVCQDTKRSSLCGRPTTANLRFRSRLDRLPQTPTAAATAAMVLSISSAALYCAIPMRTTPPPSSKSSRRTASSA